MIRSHCYFLAYRRKLTKRSINWGKPTGGLVMKPDGYCQGMPIADINLAGNLLHERYHCGPDEELIIAEVFEVPDMRKARTLHRRWEFEMREFCNLMECTDLT